MQENLNSHDVLELYKTFAGEKDMYDKSVIDNITIMNSHPAIPNVNKGKTILFKMKLQPEYANYLDNLHGGAVATIIDLATSLLLTVCDARNRQSVSVHMDINYLNPISITENILVLCELDRAGKRLGTATAEVYNEGGKLLFKGSHIKSYIDTGRIPSMEPKL